jgi:DNA modification methylase
MRSVDSLIPYARNARTHSDAQVAQIAASIREFGWTNPILVDGESGIIAGHGRLLAARKLNMPEVPCIELSSLSEIQKRAYILADNKLALNAGWDDEMLRLELGELAAMDFDTLLTGFSDEELLGLSDGGIQPGLTDEDEVSEPPVDPVTRLGDVWLMGKHRIVCGDSTDPLVVEKALNGVVPHLMVTDPPYGVEYDASWRKEKGLSGKGSAIGKVLNDDVAEWSDAWCLFPGDVAYVWHGMKQSPVVAAGLCSNGFDIRAEIVWAKSQFCIGRGDYHSQHESCWYAVRKGAKGHSQGDRTQSTLWKIDKPVKSETGHSTQKPVECMRRPIENNSSVGQAVYEPFSGSGTTIIAAETAGRCCHAIELNPAYVDMAVKRWQDFTGKPATLESDGRTFDECAQCQ